MRSVCHTIATSLLNLHACGHAAQGRGVVASGPGASGRGVGTFTQDQRRSGRRDGRYSFNLVPVSPLVSSPLLPLFARVKCTHGPSLSTRRCTRPAHPKPDTPGAQSPLPVPLPPTTIFLILKVTEESLRTSLRSCLNPVAPHKETDSDPVHPGT